MTYRDREHMLTREELEYKKRLDDRNRARDVGRFLAMVAVSLIFAVVAFPVNTQFRPQREIAALLSGMFGFASIEAFRRSF
jgi:hypothetical protein